MRTFIYLLIYFDTGLRPKVVTVLGYKRGNVTPIGEISKPEVCGKKKSVAMWQEIKSGKKVGSCHIHTNLSSSFLSDYSKVLVCWVGHFIWLILMRMRINIGLEVSQSILVYY